VKSPQEHGSDHWRDSPIQRLAESRLGSTDYTVLAYTDWADVFIPTIVEWANGETDHFTDPAASIQNKRESIQQVQMED